MVTLELCPRGELERDHPLLWKFVRDTESLGEGLPRLRYRIDLEANLNPCEEACQQWVPQLWFGRIDQRPGTQGTPDHAGHAERLRSRTTRADQLRWQTSNEFRSRSDKRQLTDRPASSTSATARVSSGGGQSA
ncbi:hypothetical protein GCM10023335_55280 [Streptomyces siamensis]|uniref:Uncharacterized protein n=1 Tax=Streptomyces siamensis TaxID=1274986 RepID=A0ABP9J977_9ACTN